MLSTVPPREHSHLNISAHPDQLALDDRLCPGCKRSAVNEQGGLVVAFGQSFFHVDCFKCAKCRNQVTADTNLLLLSDGSPICANCSYSCNICRLPILDEAIMTGDDSYHAHCFKCKVCSNRIDELVFAKTSQGIYCMNCHNERMIKIRKHAQKKAEREKANGGSGSSRSRDNEAKNFHRDQDARSGSSRSRNASSSRIQDSARSPSRPVEPMPPSYSSTNATASSSFPTQPSVTVASPADPQATPRKQLNGSHPSSDYLNQYHGLAKSNTLPIPPTTTTSNLKRTNSYNDGARPLNVPLKQDSLPASASLHPESRNATQGLTVTSKQDKRRSINPGFPLSTFKEALSNQMSNSAPANGSFQSRDRSASQTPPYLTPNEPLSRTPSSRPSSQSSSAHSRTSSLAHADLDHPLSRSRSSSLRADSNGHDDTIVMTSPPTMTLELDESTLTNGAHPQRHGPGLASLESPSSRNGPRSASPAYRADVPHGVESGTDTENEMDLSSSESHGLSPPAPPPKDIKQWRQSADGSVEADTSHLSESGDTLEELTAVERTSHATFIAPALPPIRFSMNTADFSELLSSVGGLPSLKSLDSLAKATKYSQDQVPSTPPPTASSPSIYRLSGSLEDASSDTHVEIESIATTLTAKDVQLDQESTSGSVTPLPASAFNTPSARQSESDNVIVQVRDALNEAKKQGAKHVQVDINLVDAILDVIGSQSTDYHQLKTRLDGMNRESKRFIDGMTVAQAEYDQELKARRDAEAEVTRLRVLLSGQAARLTALSGDSRRQELRQQFSKELNDNLSDLEQNLSRLKVERDVALAEMEEISSKRSNGSPVDVAPPNLARSLTKRLETLRTQYHRELMPLTEQKEALTREVAELKGVRDVFLEETTVLNARNEELAQLSAVYARRIENAPEIPAKNAQESSSRNSSDTPRANPQPIVIAPSLNSSVSGSSTVVYEGDVDPRFIKPPRSENELQTPAKPKFKWPGTRPKETASPLSNIETSKSKAHIEHNFQQLSVLRFARCDHCGEKMWGSQLRCTVCSTSIHVRCIANVQIPCSQHQPPPREEPQLPLPPSMFGRDLTEQVHADQRDDDRQVPVIVEKCIQAVGERALDYEGIYRKTGGSGQTKAITQMFERGDYDSFDLCDMDRFNDICSVTSVLKTYFRSLPVPLLTFDLHDQFMTAIAVREPLVKQKTLIDLINMLPNEHYFTLRMLMLHLNQVRERCDKNLMNGRNLGVVFGPTLMRSRDPAAEFSDMAGKALFVEWLVDNAPLVFGSE